jgi:hypothetical protein
MVIMFEDELTKAQCNEICEILEGFYRGLYQKLELDNVGLPPQSFFDARRMLSELRNRVYKLDNGHIPENEYLFSITPEVTSILGDLAFVEHYFCHSEYRSRE